MHQYPRQGCGRRLQAPSILYEDRDIIVVDKPAGLLTMGSETDRTRTAYFMLTDYVRKGCAKSRNRIFIVHRLDKETSGVIVFAKTIEAKRFLQENWDKTQKKYFAVVHGECKKDSDTISTYLAENSARVVYSTHDPARGKLSHTAYTTLKRTKDFSLLEIVLLTGRKNQIRVHLAGIGHPVVGDTKYGRKDTEHKRLSLHAWTLELEHPFSKEKCVFEAPLPAYFKKFCGGLASS